MLDEWLVAAIIIIIANLLETTYSDTLSFSEVDLILVNSKHHDSRAQCLTCMLVLLN